MRPSSSRLGQIAPARPRWTAGLDPHSATRSRIWSTKSLSWNSRLAESEEAGKARKRDRSDIAKSGEFCACPYCQ